MVIVQLNMYPSYHCLAKLASAIMQNMIFDSVFEVDSVLEKNDRPGDDGTLRSV